MNEGISPLTELESKPVSIDAGDRIWKVTNYDHTYLGRVSLSRAIGLVGQLRVRAAHRPRRAEGDRLDGAQPRHPEPTRPVLLDRSRLGRGEPARDGARVRDARQRRPARRRLGVRQPPSRRRARSSGSESSRVEENAPIPTQVLDEGARRAPHRHPRGRRPSRERASAPRSRAARSPARPGRPTTTATPGSSGYTPELVVAVWVGYPDALRPMLTEFDGEPVAGGNAARA